MSISWSRILPEGRGIVNQKGVQFYRAVFEALKNNGIEPHVTLYYCDLPQALERKGGWLNEDTINGFVEYAQLCFAQFGDVVCHLLVWFFFGMGFGTVRIFCRT